MRKLLAERRIELEFTPEAMQLLVDQAPGLFFYDTRFVTVIPDSLGGFEYNLNYPFAQFFYPMHPAG